MTERPTARLPYQAYATIMGVFAAGLALAGGVARVLGRDPRNDFLQAGFAALTSKANELGQDAGS